MRRRRDLSRRSLIAGATAAALTRPLATSAQESTPVHEDTSPRPAISLNHLGGDAWAWEKTLTGSCPGCPEDGELSLLVNGVAVPAAREGDRFSGLARFAPGENEVVAVATLADGSEERSAPVTYTVRLVPRPTARLAIRIAGDRVICDGTGSTPSEFDGAVIPNWSLQVPGSVVS